MSGLPTEEMRQGLARILIGASGGASIITLPRYLVMLRTAISCHITVLMTTSATTFVPPRTIGLFADQVIDCTDTDGSFQENHVKLAKEHDLIVIFPATAHILAEAAHGFGSSPLTSVILASPRPVIYVPAMNEVMWSKPSVQRNVAQIMADGGEVVDPIPILGFEVGVKQVMRNPSPLSPGAFANLVKERLIMRRALERYTATLSHPEEPANTRVRSA